MIETRAIDVERAEKYLSQGWWRAERTFVDDFIDNANKYPARTACVAYEVESGARTCLSYGELLELVNRCAAGLRDCGVIPGDVVSFQLPNWWQFPVIAMACARIGAILNPILPIHRAREIRTIVSSVRPRVLIGCATIGSVDYRAIHDEAISGMDTPPKRFYIDSGDHEDFQAFFLAQERACQDGLDELRPSPNDIAQVMFTSGTTGTPKGVVHTFNTLFAAYRAVSVALQLSAGDTVLTPSTMAHQTAFLSGFCMPLAEGMAAVYLDKWDAHTALGAIRAEQVTFASGATPYMHDLCDAADGQAVVIDSLKYFKSGGAPVSASLRARVRTALGATATMAWGMTENGVCTISRPGTGLPDDSDGAPLPWVELRTLKPDGKPTAPGEAGALWVRSASQCIDYYPGHSEFLEATDSSGWFNTGDLAELRQDGTLRISGRVKDMVIRGGENIPVKDVEEALSSHPAISEAAVIGVHHDRLGERAIAVIVTERNCPDVDLAVVRAHLRRVGMAKQYWPEAVVIASDLPRTTTGKVQKQMLRERYADVEVP